MIGGLIIIAAAGRWEARIGIPGSKHIYLGLHDDEDSAARAYDSALVRPRFLASCKAQAVHSSLSPLLAATLCMCVIDHTSICIYHAALRQAMATSTLQCGRCG